MIKGSQHYTPRAALVGRAFLKDLVVISASAYGTVVSQALPMAPVPTEPCPITDVTMGLGDKARMPLDQELQGVPSRRNQIQPLMQARTREKVLSPCILVSFSWLCPLFGAKNTSSRHQQGAQSRAGVTA